jgi:large subunit ribosomal protein L25
MEKAVLNATKRTIIGKQVGALRRTGKLPAVIYGHHVDPMPIQLDAREATRLLNTLSGSSLISINLDGKEFVTLVREKQRDHIRNEFIHLDFQAVSLTEKIRAMVSLELTGVAPAVKEMNGIVITGLSEIEIEALPQDLPEKFIVDISGLQKIGDAIYIKDIQLAENLHVHTNPEDMVVLITSGTIQEEVVEEEVVAAADEPEVIEKGKKEEEGEEGKE